ncbi:MAG: phosphoglycerate dehydrogenase [Phycisphaerales bacterium]|nr:phosphoglycerate dehydrogenase [Phycisphaerales bacterium]
MFRILITDPLADEGLAALAAAEGVEADVRTGLSPAELADIVGEYDGMIIRSGVKVTADVLAKPGRLRAIARAGVGVDNVDIDAATAVGILVMNTPDANTLSTAEHTMAMILAIHRRVAAAHQHVADGAWDRKAFVGEQLSGKTLGIVGLGRVGRAVAERAMAFGMRVLAFDPFLRADTAMEGRVRVVAKLDDMLSEIDTLTLHAAMTDDTRNLINADRIAKMKPSAFIVNCARGGLVDECALADALKGGKLAGAALDVFESEPPKNCPLVGADNVVLTPHLGASTRQAQTAVSTDAVDQMLDYLLKDTIRNAINVTGLPADLSARDRSYLDLTARMATILSTWCGDGVDSVEVTTIGPESLHALCPALALQALVCMMNPHINTRLTMVNAGVFAKERGVGVRTSTHAAKADYPDVVRVRFTRGGESHEIEGAAFTGGRLRVLAIDGYRMEMAPEGPLVLIFNDDRPGVIGVVGTIFGKRGINVADLFLSRLKKTALMVCKIDGAIGDDTLAEIRGEDPILSVRLVTLPPLA